jgi:hypothetical protein
MEGRKFSQNLIDRTITHFKKKYDLDISAETADVYLASFAVVFRAFVRPSPVEGGRTDTLDDY